MAVRQLNALTSLRFVAAMYVFAFHCMTTFFGLDSSSPLYLGPTGVTFFFVLSGFILAHNYAGRDFRDTRVLAQYFRARIARIVPVYIFALMAGFPFAYSTFLALEPSTFKSLFASSAVLSPLALQAWVPGAVCAINCPTWSISVEFFFYLVLPLVLAFVLKRPGYWFLLAVILLIASFAMLEALWAWSGVDGTILRPGHSMASRLLEQFIKYFPLWRLPEFLLGLALYSLWSRNAGESFTGVMFAAAFVAALTLYWFTDELPEAGLHNGLSVVVWAPLIVAAANVKSGLLHNPVFVFLGRASFSLYLLHFPVLLAAKRLGARAAAAGVPLNLTYVMLTGAFASLVVAIVVFRYVEEPSRRLIMSRGHREAR